jgi:hypothetical protein
MLPRTKFILLVLTGALFAHVAARAGEAIPNLGLAANYSFETGGLMQQIARERWKTLPAGWQSLSGALGQNAAWETNKTLPWYIEHQKDGRDYIAAGLAFGDKDLVRWGLKILEWGWAQMTPDGEFAHPDSYHSASFLVEATANSILLLEASPWRVEFAPRTEAMKPKLLACARWMIRPDIDALNWPDDFNYPRIFGERRYAHRRFLDAAALGQVAVIFHDRPLMWKTTWLIRNGIAMQQADGVNPERGGHDTSYQAYGLMYACRYYDLAADDAMRAELKPTLDKAFAWLLGRIGPDGKIDGTGNTRTGPAAEPGRTGKPKQLDYYNTGISLAHWAQLTGETRFADAAKRVFQFNLNNNTAH